MKDLTKTDVAEIVSLSRSMKNNTKKSKLYQQKELEDIDLLPTLIKYRELFEKVESLSSNALAELYALMLVGRGSSGELTSDWPRLINSAKLMNKDACIAYIIDKAPLSEYLEKGLVKLGKKI